MSPWLAVLLLAVPGEALSPGEGVVVRFKDGSSLSGVLSELGGGRVELEVGGARLSWRLDAVERVESRRTDLQEFRERERELGGDPEKARALARFARARGLYTLHARLAEGYGLLDELQYCSPGTALPDAAAAPPRPRATAPAAGQPELGFGAPAPAGGAVQSPPYFDPFAVYYPVLAAPVRSYSKEEQEAFLREQSAKREALRRRPTHPLELFQFRLQEALDRRSRGLSFTSEPF